MVFPRTSTDLGKVGKGLAVSYSLYVFFSVITVIYVMWEIFFLLYAIVGHITVITKDYQTKEIYCNVKSCPACYFQGPTL